MVLRQECAVYILLSETDGRRYIGSTNNLARRLTEHNGGKVKSTRARRPLKVIYTERFANEGLARKRERFFKTHKGYNELKKLLGGSIPACGFAAKRQAGSPNGSRIIK